MKTSRALTGALIVGSVAIASLFAATPAAAATLPAGQQITVIDPGAQFSTANPESAALTAVGVPTGLEGDRPTGVDVNDDGLGYAITTDYDFIDNEVTGFEVADGAYLYEANANTGTLTFIDEVRFFFDDFTIPMDECTGIDYTGGELYLACTEYGEEEGDRNVAYYGIWDAELGLALPIVTFNGDPEIDYDPVDAPNEPAPGFDYFPITALAIHPVSGVIYLFGTLCADGCFPAVWTVSQADGATFLTYTEGPVHGADFDRGGQLWGTTDVEDTPRRAIAPGESGLVTVNLAPAGGEFLSDAAWQPQPEFGIEPITVWGKETLAATGSTSPVAPAVAAAGILLLGAFLAAGTVVLRRRNADAL